MYFQRLRPAPALPERTLNEPFSKRDYDRKLREGNLEDLDEDDPDSHYRNLFSDKAFKDFQRKQEARDLEKQAKVAENSESEEDTAKRDKEYAKQILAQNMKYVGYFWTFAVVMGAAGYYIKSS